MSASVFAHFAFDTSCELSAAIIVVTASVESIVISATVTIWAAVGAGTGSGIYFFLGAGSASGDVRSAGCSAVVFSNVAASFSDRFAVPGKNTLSFGVVNCLIFISGMVLLLEGKAL
jgi:hypothetical protein